MPSAMSSSRSSGALTITMRQPHPAPATPRPSPVFAQARPLTWVPCPSWSLRAPDAVPSSAAGGDLAAQLRMPAVYARVDDPDHRALAGGHVPGRRERLAVQPPLARRAARRLGLLTAEAGIVGRAPELALVLHRDALHGGVAAQGRDRLGRAPDGGHPQLRHARAGAPGPGVGQDVPEQAARLRGALAVEGHQVAPGALHAGLRGGNREEREDEAQQSGAAHHEALRTVPLAPSP